MLQDIHTNKSKQKDKHDKMMVQHTMIIHTSHHWDSENDWEITTDKMVLGFQELDRKLTFDI